MLTKKAPDQAAGSRRFLLAQAHKNGPLPDHGAEVRKAFDWADDRQIQSAEQIRRNIEESQEAKQDVAQQENAGKQQLLGPQAFTDLFILAARNRHCAALREGTHARGASAGKQRGGQTATGITGSGSWNSTGTAKPIAISAPAFTWHKPWTALQTLSIFHQSIQSSVRR